MTAKQQLERLGKYVASRRVALGLKNRIDLANSVNFSDRVLADIENGVRPASAGSYAMLENALQWKPGSVDAVLAGGEPAVIHEQDASLNTVPTDDLLAEIRRRIPENDIQYQQVATRQARARLVQDGRPNTADDASGTDGGPIWQADDPEMG